MGYFSSGSIGGGGFFAPPAGGGGGGGGGGIQSQTKYPTIIETLDWGSAAWANLNNAKTNDASYATCAGLDSGGSNPLISRGYGFTIPNGALVVGATVDKLFKASGDPIVDDGMYIFIGDPAGDATYGDDREDLTTPWPSMDSVVTYGQQQDQWNLNLPPATVNADNFGVLFEAICNDGSGTASVNAMPMTVYYATDYQTVEAPCRAAVVADHLSADIHALSGVTWDDLAFAYATGPTNFASATMDASGYSQFLVLTDLGLTLPNDATVIGYRFSFSFKTDAGGTFLSIPQFDVYPIVGGVCPHNLNGLGYYSKAEVTNYAAGGIPDGDYIYNAVGQNWDLILTPADVNASGFGFAINVQGASENAIAYINSAKVTLYYI